MDKKNQRKWTVEYPLGTYSDGWYGLVACFDRALDLGLPILDADYLTELPFSDAKKIFSGLNGQPIPLLHERLANLKEAGSVLKKNFNGSVNNLLVQSDFNAGTLAKLTVKHFPSFNDSSTYNNKPVYFFKRAQILAYDLSLLKNINLTNIEDLTLFADYKIPQLLRSFGVLRYKKQLASKVDRKILIPQGSKYEIEIRAFSVQVGEMISKMVKTPPALIDNALWNLAHNTKKRMRPYHRTPSTCY